MGLLAVRATTIPRGKPGMGGVHQEGGLRQKGKQSLLVFRSGCQHPGGRTRQQPNAPAGAGSRKRRNARGVGGGSGREQPLGCVGLWKGTRGRPEGVTFLDKGP